MLKKHHIHGQEWKENKLMHLCLLAARLNCSGPLSLRNGAAYRSLPLNGAAHNRLDLPTAINNQENLYRQAHGLT